MKTPDSRFPIRSLFRSSVAASALAIAAAPLISLGHEDFSKPVITTETKKDAKGKDATFMFIDGIKVHETDLTKQKAIAEAVQVRYSEVVTHAFLGQWYQPQAHSKKVVGILTSPAPVFWNIDLQ